MAKIYAGDTTLVDGEVMAAVERLPDDIYCFFEFTIARNVDLFLLRSHGEAPAALIMTELKRTNEPLRGGLNGPWERLNARGDWEIFNPSSRDCNPYQQAVHTANSLSMWLWNNQARFRRDPEILPERAFRAWPEVLILSPRGVAHRLPVRPDNRYGSFFRDLEQWTTALLHWQPREGVALTTAEIEALAEILGLQRLAGAAPIAAVPTSLPVVNATREELWAALHALTARVEHLEAELEARVA